MLSLYSFQAFDPPDQFSSIEADISNLDRVPETAQTETAALTGGHRSGRPLDAASRATDGAQLPAGRRQRLLRFQITVRADEEGAHWRATGRRDEMRVLRDGFWSLAEWNELVQELEKHGLRKLQNVPHYAATREVKADQRKVRFVPFEQKKGLIEQLDQQLYQAVRKKIKKDWTTEVFYLKIASASKVIGFLKGQFRGDAVFTQTAESAPTPKLLKNSPSTYQNLDRIPNPRLLPPSR